MKYRRRIAFVRRTPLEADPHRAIVDDNVSEVEHEILVKQGQMAPAIEGP